MRKLLISLLALLFPLVGMAQNEAVDLMKVIPTDPDVRIGTLDNGAKYYIRHNAKDKDRANFHIVYDVGAVQEEDHQNGLAHFLEHMAFNGLKNFPENKLREYLQSIGIRFGENLNAGTDLEYTTYMVTNVPVIREGIIDSVLLVLHDWAGFIDLDINDINEERGVILEELRGGQDASRRILEKLAPYMYNNSIYSKRNVIGTPEILKSFTRDDIYSFYKKWYRPDMQAFIIVGDIDVDQVEAKLKTVMADVKASEVQTPKEKVVIEDNEAPIVGIVTDPELTSTQVQLLFRHAPLPREYKNLALNEKLDILYEFINQMINERCDEVTQKEDAPFLSGGAAYFNLREPFDAFYSFARSKDGESLTALEAAYTELLRMDRGGFVNSEFERAKNELLSWNETQFKNSNDRQNQQFVNQYSDNFLKGAPLPSAEYSYELNKQIIESTTLEEINATAKTLVRDMNSSILIAAPASSSTPTDAEVLAVIEKVKASEIEIFVDDVKDEPLVDQDAIIAGTITKTEVGKFDSKVWTLSNGIKVVLKHTDFQADEIIMVGTKQGGISTISNLDDCASISFYPYFASNAGLGNFTQNELTKVLSGKIANTNVNLGDLYTSVNGRSTPKDIETLLQLTYLNITAPRFEQTDLNVVKNQWLSMLPNILKTPDFINAIEVMKTSYNSNPRAMLRIPSIENIELASIERMERVYKELISDAAGMTFIFTGSFDEETLKPLVEKYIASLPTSKAIPAFGTNKTTLVTGEVTHTFETPMETPKVTANVIYSGAIDWNDDELANIRAIEHILDLCYAKSIREEAGGTYGVGVRMSPNKYPDKEYELLIRFGTDISKIDELLPLVYKETELMKETGVSAENLTIFKEYAVKKFAENNINNAVWRGYLYNWYMWGNDNYTNYLKSIEKITNESIQKTAQRLFTQGNIITVIQKPEITDASVVVPAIEIE